MQGVDSYVIRGTDAAGNVRYYTGRAGEGWLADSIQEAFGYKSLEGARAKATSMNRMMPIHGWRFSVPWIQDYLQASRVADSTVEVAK